VVRGTVLVHRRRCGKPNCRCATGEVAHDSTVLSYKERGKTKFLMLPEAEVALVRAAGASGLFGHGWSQHQCKSVIINSQTHAGVVT
jgi:hypothetical protein